MQKPLLLVELGLLSRDVRLPRLLDLLLLFYRFLKRMLFLFQGLGKLVRDDDPVLYLKAWLCILVGTVGLKRGGNEGVWLETVRCKQVISILRL